MRWVTRPGVHIDRAACAWLIRRVIDPSAEFGFVADPDQAVGSTPFDMVGVELSHHHHDGVEDCSFETILRRYEVSDPVLWRVAELVHEADLEDDRYDAPEAPGLDVIVRGLSMTLDDNAVLAATAPLFDGLVSGAARWPRGVSGVGGRELARLGQPSFLPHHRHVAVGGIGPDPTPRRLRRAATRFAQQWRLL